MKSIPSKRRNRNNIKLKCSSCGRVIDSFYGRRKSKENIFPRKHKDDTGFECSGSAFPGERVDG